MKRFLHRVQLLALLLPFVAVGAIYAYGSTLPGGHSFARAVQVARPPETAFALLADVAGWPSWSSRALAVTSLPADDDGRERWRVAFGERRATYVTRLVERPPERLALKLVDPAGPYRGEWRFAVVPVAGGCRVELEELARFGNPFARFLVRLAAGKTRLAEAHLRDLALALGEPAPRIEEPETAP